jgi:hypothetical protein
VNNKAFILALYFVALFIILKNYYKKNSGMPYPTTITAPSYLYAVLGLASDFTGGFATVLAAGLTLGLFYRTHNGNDPLTLNVQGTTYTIKPHNTKTNVKPPVKPGTNP